MSGIFDKKIIGLFLLLMATIAVIFWNEYSYKEVEEEEVIIEEEEEIIIPRLQIIDEDSKTRPIAIMINNHPNTIPHHAGLQEAFIIYEIIVEGSFTRLMALYRDQDTKRIGSVRSARHYYLDYALEYDAIYTHFGGSPQSYTDLRSLGVNNLDFIARNAYYRDNTLGVALEHRAYTSIASINEELEKMKTRMTSEVSLLDYSIEEINIEGDEVSDIEIIYGSNNKVTYQYDNNVFYRTINGVDHIDAVSKEHYNFKNIVIMRVRNYPLDNKGRQELDTVGSGEGYFLTNGQMQRITWQKNSRSGQTVYKNKDGETIVFNDGNTIFQIVPSTASVTFNKEV